MTIRERTYEIERQTLSQYAMLSENTAGRAFPEEMCPLRADFQRDRDRILHCKAFRRLKQKTQVFLSPEGDHYRTRLTHTLEVSQIARTISRALRLNEDLTEAIALGHDLGHTPFGHAGERALNSLNPEGFRHYLQSVRVLSTLEHSGEGLNLTSEVLDGIGTHTKGDWAKTLEGRVVRYADHIAYINHDIEDAISAEVLNQTEIPKSVIEVLGNSRSARITTFILDIVNNSGAEINFSPLIKEQYDVIHAFMFSTVYAGGKAKAEEKKVDKLIAQLYNYYIENIDKLPIFYQQIASNEGAQRAVTDYISGMSDEYAINTFEVLFVPKKWRENR